PPIDFPPSARWGERGRSRGGSPRSDEGRFKDGTSNTIMPKDSGRGKDGGGEDKSSGENKPSRPLQDSSIATSAGPGEVDAKRIKELAEEWSRLPPREREASMRELTRDMPAHYREAIQEYFRPLSQDDPVRRKIADATPPDKVEAEARKRYEAVLEASRRAPGSVSPEELRGAKLLAEYAAEAARKKQKSSQVWRRDGRQPTFARVHLGGGNSLELVSLHVTVTVEGPRARTLVDHVFRNPHDRQLEGTFEYPLPTGASPSYFAMFLGQTRDTVPERFARRRGAPALPEDALARLQPEQLVKHVDSDDWGRLQEARVVGKEKALETYEDTVRGQIDPALLEHAGGNIFRGRVFPIPRKGYNRVLIAYEELLPVTQGRGVYRFPLPDCELQEVKLTLNANPAECKSPAFRPDKAEKSEGKSHLTYHRIWEKKGPGGDALFTFTPTNS